MTSASSTTKPTPAYQVTFDDKGHVLQLSGKGKSTITTSNELGQKGTYLYASLISPTRSLSMKFHDRVSETQTPCLKTYHKKTKIDPETTEEEKPKILKRNQYIEIADAFTEVHANPSKYFATITGDLSQDDSQILLQRTQALKALEPGKSFTVAYIENSTTHPAFLTFILEEKRVVVKNIQSLSDTVIDDFVHCGVENKTEIQSANVRLTHVKDLKKNPNQQQPIVSQAKDKKIEEIIQKIMSEQDADFKTESTQPSTSKKKPRRVSKTSSQGHDSEMSKTTSNAEVKKLVEIELAIEKERLKTLETELKTKSDELIIKENALKLLKTKEEHTSTLKREQDITPTEVIKLRQELKTLRESFKQMATAPSTHGPSAPPPPMGAGAPPPPPPPPPPVAKPVGALSFKVRTNDGGTLKKVDTQESKNDPHLSELTAAVRGKTLKPANRNSEASKPPDPKDESAVAKNPFEMFGATRNTRQHSTSNSKNGSSTDVEYKDSSATVEYKLQNSSPKLKAPKKGPKLKPKPKPKPKIAKKPEQ